MWYTCCHVALLLLWYNWSITCDALYTTSVWKEIYMTTLMQVAVDTLKARFIIFSFLRKDGDSLFGREDRYEVNT